MKWEDVYSGNVIKAEREEELCRKMDERMRVRRAEMDKARARSDARKRRVEAAATAFGSIRRPAASAVSALASATAAAAGNAPAALSAAKSAVLPAVPALTRIMPALAVAAAVAVGASALSAAPVPAGQAADEGALAAGQPAPVEQVVYEGHQNNWEHITSDDFAALDEAGRVELIGAMAHDDEVATGIPAELTAAQALLESGWMESGLAVDHENYFGIKASTDGFNWEGSTWVPGEEAVMATQEEYEPGVKTDIVDAFRTYGGTWDSVRDHSAYLANMTCSDGTKMYPGIADGVSADEAIDILVAGGYATDSEYAEALRSMIDTYDLERFSA